MSPVGATLLRTTRLCGNFFSMAVLTSLFFAAAGALLAFNLEASEGSPFSLPQVWAVSVAPFLPALAAFLAMDSWSDEIRSGRIDLMLSIPVPESDLVVGKFLGVWLVLAVDTLVSLVSSIAILYFIAPGALNGVGLVSFLPAVFGLLMQGALWCAISVAISSFCRLGAVSACVSMALLAALPRSIWYSLMLWAPQGRPAFGEMPLDAQISDFAAGVISLPLVVTYALAVSAALFIATHSIQIRRCCGRRSFGERVGHWTVSVLALVSAASLSLLVLRFNLTIDIPVGRAAEFSPRMRQVLSDSAGNVGKQTAVLEVLSSFDSASMIQSEDVMRMGDYIIHQIEKTTSNVDQKAFARAIFDYVKTHLNYVNGNNEDDWQVAAVDALTLGYGDSACFYGLSRLLLTCAGYDNMMVERQNPNLLEAEDDEEDNKPVWYAQHFWNLVRVNGAWYHFDACPYCGGNDFFLWTDAQMDAFSAANGNCFERDKSLYPVTPG